MNVFGLNSATLNGSTYAVVFGAALALAGASIQAAPTNTRPGATPIVSVTATVQASGVRNVLPSALASALSTGSGEGVYATTSSALGVSTGTLRATATAALALPKATNTAAGTIIRPGAATGPSTSSGTATGLLIAGHRVEHLIGVRIYADPSVKRSGQTTTERDGFAIADQVVTVTALAERLPRGYVDHTTFATATALATQIVGGNAVIECACTITALAAHDVAAAVTYSTGMANPTLYAMADAVASSGAVGNVGSTVTQQGVCNPVVIQSAATAAERLAQRGAALYLTTAGIEAAPRLAILGEARAQLVTDITAFANAYRYAGALADLVQSTYANGTRVCMGEVSLLIGLKARAAGMANPAVPAPFERSMRVARDDRAQRVPPENRTMRVV